MANLPRVFVALYLASLLVAVFALDFDPLLDVEQNYDRNVSSVRAVFSIYFHIMILSIGSPSDSMTVDSFLSGRLPLQ